MSGREGRSGGRRFVQGSRGPDSRGGPLRRAVRRWMRVARLTPKSARRQSARIRMYRQAKAARVGGRGELHGLSTTRALR